MARAVALVVLSVALAAAGFCLATGEAAACAVGVGDVCVIPGGGGGCDESGCYPCDPRPGHPFDCW